MTQLDKNTNKIENIANEYTSQLNTDLEYVLELEPFSSKQENFVIIFMICCAILIRHMALSSLRIWKKI